MLASTLPGYVTISGSTITPTTQATPTASPSPSPTKTPSPTVQPTILPTQVTTGTRLALTVFMHGIGNSGDNANPTSFSLSNKTPKFPARTVTVSLYDSSNNLAASASGLITYNAANGNFTGVIPLPETVASGQYLIKIKEPLHLKRLIPGIQTITQNNNNQMPAITLVAGDTNNDNALNIVDYSTLIGCYSDLQAAVSCTDEKKNWSDLNDDGSVNQVDYSLFLREITVQNGD